MKKYIIFILITLFISSSLFSQKIISEGTIHYKIIIKNADKAIDNATSTIYLKGSLSRIDMVNSLGSETTIHDSKDGSAVILKQYSGQKLMITLTEENWIDKYKNYNGIVFQTMPETKKIAGYHCKNAIAKLKDGTSFSLYYTTDLNLFNKEYDPIFKSLPGLPVQYEFEKGKLSFQFTIETIDLNPVPSAKFEIPKSGYRIMTYDENKQDRKE